MAERTPSMKNQNLPSPTGQSQWPKYLLIGLLTLLLVLLVMGMFARGAAHRYGWHDGGRKHHHLIGSRLNDANAEKVSGTVTKVEGDTITVAGYGTTKTVKKTSGTTYRHGNEVKVNDTVIVLGETKDNTFEANTIVINP